MDNDENTTSYAGKSYYFDSLKEYLDTYGFEDVSEQFIRERADLAVTLFEDYRRDGMTVDAAQEIAMHVLFEGLLYSQFEILSEVLENEFTDEFSEESRPRFVRHLFGLNEAQEIFSRYDMHNDAFVSESDYDALYTELTGIVATKLSEYGI